MKLKVARTRGLGKEAIFGGDSVSCLRSQETANDSKKGHVSLKKERNCDVFTQFERKNRSNKTEGKMRSILLFLLRQAHRETAYVAPNLDPESTSRGRGEPTQHAE